MHDRDEPESDNRPMPAQVIDRLTKALEDFVALARAGALTVTYDGLITEPDPTPAHGTPRPDTTEYADPNGYVKDDLYGGAF